jgi:hypothetical protein
VATEEVNVSTIEDPIEMIEPRLNQTQVQPQLDFGFAEGVRALMRQDPDIIMVGEIRDLETAEMAVQAALTGHLVFSTLHTNDAPSAFTRLMELGVPPYLLNATLLGVLAQRLVRTLCPLCKRVDDEASTALLAEAVRPWKINGQLPPVPGGGLRRMPHDRLPRAHGHLRAAGGERRLSRPGARRRGPGGAAQAGGGRRHAPAAPGRRAARGRRADHAGRGDRGHAAASMKRACSPECGGQTSLG